MNRHKKVRIRIRDRGDCYLGDITIPLHGGGKLHASSLGWSPFSALKKAATIAKRMVDNPVIQHLLPPQVTLAIKAAKTVAQVAAAHPQLLKTVARVAQGVATGGTSEVTRLVANKLLSMPTVHPKAPPAAAAAIQQQQAQAASDTSWLQQQAQQQQMRADEQQGDEYFGAYEDNFPADDAEAGIYE